MFAGQIYSILVKSQVQRSSSVLEFGTELNSNLCNISVDCIKLCRESVTCLLFEGWLPVKEISLEPRHGVIMGFCVGCKATQTICVSRLANQSDTVSVTMHWPSQLHAKVSIGGSLRCMWRIINFASVKIYPLLVNGISCYQLSQWTWWMKIGWHLSFLY